MNPIERSAIATTPGQHAGAEDRHQQQRPDQRIDRARRHDDEQRNRSHEQHARRGVARRQECDRHREDNGQQRAERRDRERVPERPPQLVEIGPARRHHARTDIGGLPRCIQDERPDRVLGHDLPAEHEQRDQQQPAEPPQHILPRRGAAPFRKSGAVAGDRHYWIALRMRPEEYSQTITIAMMMIRMAAAVSYS